MKLKSLKNSALLFLAIGSLTSLAVGASAFGNDDVMKAVSGSGTSGTGGGSITGPYPIYYGHLHNHTSFSDGTDTPAEGYLYARDVAKLDFFGIADHSQAIDANEWTITRNAADSFNQDGSFVTFAGFEWSSHNLGHVTVINTSDYCSHENAATDTFPELVSWLSTRECAAFFNHPGRQDSDGQEFSQFTTAPSSKFVGMELWNKSDGFSTYYYNDGYYTGDGKGHFDEALTRKWMIGASGSDDNHSATWGTDNENRLAVLATAKTRAAIYDAIKARRFYSTLDKNLQLFFDINGKQMGSAIAPGTFTATIKAGDGNGEIFKKVDIIKNGTLLQSWTISLGKPVITRSVACAVGDYFYVRVKQADGQEAITSPIFVK